MEPTQTAVISGGMGDIGRAIAARLSQDGYQIALLYRSQSESEAQEFVKTLAGSGHLAVKCDITNATEVGESIAHIKEQTGRVDACIHAAVSPLKRAKASAITLENFTQQLEVTMCGGLLLFQACIPHMKEKKGGAIVGITTSAIEPGAAPATMAGYLAAKAALRSLLRDLSYELKPFNIRVSAVAPGFVPTALHGDLPQRAFDFILETQPNKTFTAPADVASVVAKVLDPANNLSGMSVPMPGEPTPL